MKSEIRTTERWGKVLWLSSETVEVGIALEFGIRIVHVSCKDMENLYYVQPADLSDNFTTPGGWRLHGGHRMWLAPEGEYSYYPDNDPVSYTLEENGVLIEQQPDPVAKQRKRLRVTFVSDDTVHLEHSFENLSDQPVEGASWGINTLDGGGVAEINFSCGTRGGYNPKRVVSLWSDTDLHDPRLHFTKETLQATYIEMDGYLKLGLYSNPCKAVFRNKGQQLTISAEAAPLDRYMDNGCNFELYMCRRFMELETLGVRTQCLPGQSACHTEVWQLTKL